MEISELITKKVGRESPPLERDRLPFISARAKSTSGTGRVNLTYLSQVSTHIKHFMFIPKKL